MISKKFFDSVSPIRINFIDFDGNSESLEESSDFGIFVEFLTDFFWNSKVRWTRRSFFCSNRLESLKSNGNLKCHSQTAFPGCRYSCLILRKISNEFNYFTQITLKNKSTCKWFFEGPKRQKFVWVVFLPQLYSVLIQGSGDSIKFGSGWMFYLVNRLFYTYHSWLLGSNKKLFFLLFLFFFKFFLFHDQLHVLIKIAFIFFVSRVCVFSQENRNFGHVLWVSVRYW